MYVEHILVKGLKSFSLKYSNVRLYFGEGALSNAACFLKGFEKACVVTSRSAAKVSGALSDVDKLLKELGVQYFVYDKISPNPWASQAEELGHLLWSEGVDLVIAIGGGSVIDAAKVASIIALSGSRVIDYVSGRKHKRMLPLLAVNLTHGTGSEVNRYAVLTLDDSREKHGINSRYPELSIDDPKYTVTLSKAQTIYTTLDAFYHSYEAATATTANQLVDTLSREAISIAASKLPELINDLGNVSLRADVLYSSMIAGISIDLSSTHIVHAIEHAVSGLEPKLPHGCGLGILGPRAAYYIHKSMPEKSVRLLKSIDPGLKPLSEHAERASKAIQLFQESVGFNERLSDYGFTDKDVDRVVEYTLRRLKYMVADTPFNVTEDVVRDIFLSSL